MSYDYSENILVQESAGHLLEDELGWRVELAYNTEVLGETGTFGRKSYKEILLVKYLKQALSKLNPWLTPALLEDAIKTFESHMSSASLMQINEEKYRHIRDGIPVKVKKPNGQIEEKKAIVIDFTNTENNDFLAIKEMKIHGDLYRRRTDIVGFVNGIPLLFIELKKNSVDVQNAYTDNYTDYLDTIPHLFYYNAFLMLSNGTEAKVGTLGSKYEFFHEWKRLSEQEEGNVALETMLRGICKKDNFLDLLENFILFDHSDGKTVKILARNHQYLGVNEAVKAYEARKLNNGKLGVFWHTQGSGKSYSMVFLSQKIRRKFAGSPTIVILTDRDELNTQISDTFENCGLLGKTKAAKYIATSGDDLITKLQGNPTVFISRINNASILDKSSREGIIENESFKLLKDALIRIISILEKDRAYIARSFKIYDDRVNHKEKTKQEGSQIAKSVLSGKKDKNYKAQKEKMESLAKTVQYFEEEREELTTELKLLRALATNGLITTSIVHDLKSINALLVNRVEPMRMAIENDNKMLIERNLNDLYKNDQFLKSWITVVTNQSKKDKRKRLKKNIYDTIEKIVNVLQPILVQKKVQVELIKDEQNAERRIFESDFESIFYNLIINSIEAFSKSSTKNRKIRIELKTNENLVVNYLDNGDGLDNKFKNPYEIFTLGSTSKYDQFGNVIGTGLGMYIIASTVREYNGDYKLTQIQNGFGLEIRIPL